MTAQNTTQFKALALDDDTLRRQAPSIFAPGPMAGVSPRYTFVPTARIVSGLREHDWVPVAVEEQRIRNEARRGFQKHLLRFRRAEQMETLDEWNVELVLLNSHDRGCAYQLHAGIYRRICANGLVIGEGSFQTLRFRHAGLQPEEVVQASFRLFEFLPRVGECVGQFQARILEPHEALALAEHALVLRYGSLAHAPISADTLLTPRRPEDMGNDLWTALNKAQEQLIRGALSDGRRDRHGRLRTVRALHGIDSKVQLNQALWTLAERLAHGETLPPAESVALAA